MYQVYMHDSLTTQMVSDLDILAPFSCTLISPVLCHYPDVACLACDARATLHTARGASTKRSPSVCFVTSTIMPADSWFTMCRLPALIVLMCLCSWECTCEPYAQRRDFSLHILLAWLWHWSLLDLSIMGRIK